MYTNSCVQFNKIARTFGTSPVSFIKPSFFSAYDWYAKLRPSFRNCPQECCEYVTWNSTSFILNVSCNAMQCFTKLFWQLNPWGRNRRQRFFLWPSVHLFVSPGAELCCFCCCTYCCFVFAFVCFVVCTCASVRYVWASAHVRARTCVCARVSVCTFVPVYMRAYTLHVRLCTYVLLFFYHIPLVKQYIHV